MSAQLITIRNLDTGAEATTARLICDRRGCGLRLQLDATAVPGVTAAMLRDQATSRGWQHDRLGDCCDGCRPTGALAASDQRAASSAPRTTRSRSGSENALWSVGVPGATCSALL